MTKEVLLETMFVHVALIQVLPTIVDGDQKL